jgi:methylmalonyl-CoA epimerase
MKSNGFDGLRQEIERIDDLIIRLLGERVLAARNAGTLKSSEGVEVSGIASLEEALDGIESLGRTHKAPPELVRRVYRVILDEAGSRGDESGDDWARGLAGDEGGPSSVLARNSWGIDHVAIAVRDLEAAVETFQRRFGFEVTERTTTEGVHSGMESAVLRAGEIKFVLVQGTSSASNVCQYIENYGSGVQHVALRVENVEAVLADLERRDCDLLTQIINGPGIDQVFTRRDVNSGMQIEVIARAQNDDFSSSNVRELFEAMERENVY